VGGNRRLKETTGAELIIHALDAPLLPHLNDFASAFGLNAENSPPPDRTVKEGDTIQVGEITLKVIHTPGHSPGGIALYTDGILFAGDTLFAGSIGRTDFPGGDFDTLIRMIQTKLFTLPDDTRVYAGHNQETTIGMEKKYNPFAGMQ
jgi:glyoxylase-like metal-dependent hydrolase (beta-lactamase superfamily II)